ncbi:MAG: deoxyribonuclease IV [Deltaproteobacteria bacterium]
MTSSGRWPLGVHTSVAGGLWKAVDGAVDLGCDAMQIFARNPRSWADAPLSSQTVSLFRKAREEAGLWPVAVHTTYLINLCAPDPDIYEKSIILFQSELRSSEALGADYLVTHLGSPKDMGIPFAMERVKASLKAVADAGLGRATKILLENTSGAGTGFGADLADIAELLDAASSFGLEAGLCADTCHGFAAGYAVSGSKGTDGFVASIEASVGLERLKLIHLNDSKGKLGSKLDRHENIGRGEIGIDGITSFLLDERIAGMPLILETPKKTPDDDPENLRIVRSIISGAKRKKG